MSIENLPLDKMNFPLSPADIELLHRVNNITGIETAARGTVDTGGGVMNDLYTLSDGRIVCVYEYGICLYLDADACENSDYQPLVEWSEINGGEYLPHYLTECGDREFLESIWESNCELIYGESGSADELQHSHKGQISAYEFEWVELFISEWEAMEASEAEEMEQGRS